MHLAFLPQLCIPTHGSDASLAAYHTKSQMVSFLQLYWVLYCKYNLQSLRLHPIKI
ncbi:hypothetical protein RchiOBHm_Chr1g0335011 [Rosa chinensis]|uniref:Uncharacterized protein n=1 Tax=Rosa chinensis TaxID=74649 RepID=A0A2P6SCH7_ROSCH|nr:hypothetical protein RchiOBHm_Chr1g0335011 [Rosa chinensis]